MTHWMECLIFSQTWMLIAWGFYRYIHNPMLADIAWGLGIMILAYLHVLLPYELSTYTLFMLGLVTIWALRLSFYLYWTRLRPQHLDKRYALLKKNDKNNFFQNYQIQGILQNIIALPWYFIPQAGFSWLSYIAIFIFIIGFCIEWLADSQLSSFKKHGQGVCQIGLWRFSRHPNYFGECLIWLGFAIAGFGQKWGFLSLLSPIGLYAIMRFITGPLTEETSIQSKGKAYLDYQATTPMIIPHFYKLFKSNCSK